MRSIKSQSALCTRAQWTMTVIMVSLLVLFLAFGFRPAVVRQRHLQASIELCKRELETSRTRAANFMVLTNEVRRLENQLLKFNKRLPKTMELPEFIQEMTLASQHAGLKPVYQPQSVKRLDLYCEVPINMTFSGDFMGVFGFLRHLEGMQRLTRVKTLNLKAKDSKLGLVEASLVMNIYFSDQ